ncbi:MAG: PEP-CTERM sorting domain-containing protein [Thermoguttaceae bacterium]|nr:PEP-CTERM sorting domain-containing protein [Thermoguttaceae bacterium]
MKNAYRLFVGLLICAASALSYADVVPVQNASSASDVLSPMGPNTTVWVQSTTQEIELYNGSTPGVPANSQGLIIGGAGASSQIKVLAGDLQNLGQTTVSSNGSLVVSSTEDTNYFDKNLTIDGGSVLVRKGFYSTQNGSNVTISDGSLEFLGRFRVGYQSAATFDQTGGTVTFNTIESGDNKVVSIGYKSGANGTYNMSGGTFTTPIPVLIGDQSGATGVLTITGGTFNGADTRVGNAGVGTLNINGGEFNETAWINMGYEASGSGVLNVDGGTLNYTANDMRVGRRGTGEFNLNSGTVNMTGKTLVLGYYSGSNGTFNMTGGTLNVQALSLGEKEAGTTGTANISNGVYLSIPGDINAGSYGTGTLNLDSATIYTDGYLYVGNHTGSTGEVNLTNGATFTYPAHSMRIGQSGTGTLNVESSSSLNGAEIYLGYNEAGNGTLNLDNASVTSKSIVVGNLGTGTVNASGSTVNITGALNIGGNEADTKPAGTGNATFSNGSSLTTTTNVSVGTYGQGTLTIDASNATIGADGYLYVGNHTGSTGTVTLQNGATLSTPGHTPRIGQSGTGVMNVLSGSRLDSSAKDIHIGYNAAGNGTLNIDGGTASSLKVWVGNSGTGTLSVRNGFLDTNSNHIYVGNNSGSTGTLNLMAGGLIDTKTSHVYVGTAAGSNGTFNMSGGILTSGDLRVGDTGTGVANITGGMVDLAYVMYAGIYNGASGTINISGADTRITTAGNIYAGYDAGATGSITVDGATVNGGSELRIARYGNGTMTLKNDAKVSATGIINVAQYENSTGEINVEGGTLTGNGELRVADLGKGTMTITGGSVSASGLANVGYGAGSEGKVSIANGTLTLTNAGASFRIGRYGTGSVEVLDGGQLIVENNSTHLGYYGGGYGTLSIDGGYAKLKRLEIGYAADATGYFEMKDGKLDILAVTDGNEINVGYNGYGYAKISGGEVNLVSLRVGRENGSFGQLTIEGDGVMNLSSAARISFNAGSEGRVFIKDNGQLNVTKELTIGNSDVGYVEVSGGQLNANPIVIKDNGSSMKVTGGMVTSPSITIPQASSLDWTGGGMDVKTVNGDLVQNGGVLYPGVSTIVAAEILGNYTLSSAGKVVIDIDQTNSVWDTINVTNGNLDLNGTLLVNFAEDVEPFDSYQIFNVTGGTMDVADVTLEFPDWYSYGDLWSLSSTGLLQFGAAPSTGVPEPSTWALLILGSAGLLYWRKRK